MTKSCRIRKKRKANAIHQASCVQGQYCYEPMRIFSEDQIEDIHRASLRILQNTGIDFLLPKAVQILKMAGADVDSDNVRVRFDPDFVMQAISTTPSSFTLHARNSSKNRKFGHKSVAFSMVGSPPYVSDIDRGRLSGNNADYRKLIKLGQSIDVVDAFCGYPVEPIDLPVPTRYLDALHSIVTLSDKPFACYSLGRKQVQDAIEIARIVRGIDNNSLEEEPSIHSVVNSNSPLVYDRQLLEGAIALAERNQPVIYTPFTLSGAMAPVTLAGALAQQNAEALAGIVLSQCVRKGAPAVYGSFTSNVDMRSGSPAFGTPEYSQATIASGQIARRYNIPLRASNANASNAPDAQAAYESQMSLWACMMGQINYVMHGFGWIEGGLCASFEKVIMDAEMTQMMKAFLKPPTTTVDDLATEVINEVGPANHFFQSPHTLERYESAFYTPLLSDWQNFENWKDRGQQNATVRANSICKHLLKDYKQPKMDPAIREELDEFIEKRKLDLD